ncbi:MAG: HlyD family efflux transporter periplasmic adaptor subunit [Massiliimalia sp.]|jgi:hypothetical protein
MNHMSAKTARLVGVLLSLFALFYFGYQIYLFTYTPYDTEIATVYEYTDRIDLHGVVIKSEQVIQQDYQGILRYQHGNSQKVSTGSSVATIYASETDLMNSAAMDEKQEQIDLLNDLESRRTLLQTGAQNSVSGIKKEQQELLTAVHTHEMDELGEIKSNFLSQLLKQQMILDSSISFADQIAALQAEKDQLATQITTQPVEIPSPAAGYFTNEIDGYEQAFTAAALDDLSLDAVQNLLNNTSPDYSQNYIGKVITDTKWNFLALVPTKEISRLSTGQDVFLVFPSAPNYKVAATISDLKLYAQNEFSVIVLESNIMNENIINLRMEDPAIVFDTQKALRVPKEAVRMVNMEVEEEVPDESVQVAEGEEQPTKTVTKEISQAGVYINMGQVVKFRKIEILDETDNYVICSMNDESDYLQLYDEVILGGTDLYDNKPI